MANSPASVSCPSCAAKLPLDSRFCPQCGTRLGAGETLEMNPGPVLPDASVAAGPPPQHLPPEVHHAHRRPFGVHPVPLLGGLGGLALLVAIVLLVGGSLVVGLVLLALAIALLMLFFGGVRREPDAPAAGPTLRTASRLRSLAELAMVIGRAWIRAGVELLRIRRRQHQLRTELKASLTPLGEAIHHDEHERARALKEQAAELERKLGETERQASAAIATARQEIEHERMTVEPTRSFTLQDVEQRPSASSAEAPEGDHERGDDNVNLRPPP